MELNIVPGTYVVAVSGGVDSMALLDMLAKQPNLRLVVAHLDHGIRPDSNQDRKLVQDVAKRHGLPFVYDQVFLGAGTSEDTARKARYDFLHRTSQASGARAVITAHHKDDALETAILHLLRGTGRRGMSALGSNYHLIRPLLSTNKQSLTSYAKANGLVWREDSTNTDTRYLRNKLRHRVIPKLSKTKIQKLHVFINRMRDVNKEIDDLLNLHLHLQPKADALDRKWFSKLPYKVAREVMAHWLRRQGVANFDKKQLETMVISLKTLRPGKHITVGKELIIEIKKDVLALKRRDR